MPQHLAYRHALASKLDDLGRYTAFGSTTDTLILLMLQSAVTGLSPNRYDTAWLHAYTSTASVGQTRRVEAGSYVPSSGTLGVVPVWSVLPALGWNVEMTRLFPAVSENVQSEDTSYRTLINRALSKLIIPDRTTFAITTSDTYPVQLPWLDRESRLVRVLEPAPVAGRHPVDSSWRNWKLIVDGQAPVLQTDVSFSTASGVITLDVLRPANTWIATGGVWAETLPSSGLVNEGDEAVPQIDDVLPVALMLAYEALASRSPGQPSGPWRDKYEKQVALAKASRFWDWTAESTQAPSTEAA